MNTLQQCTAIKRMIVAFLMVLLLAATVKANITSYQKTKDGVSFLLDKGRLFIHVIGDDVIEIKYTNLPAMPDKKSLAVLNDIALKSNFLVAEKGSHIVITIGKLIVKIDRKTNAITYTDLAGNEVLSESRAGNKIMRDTTVAGIQTFSCATTFNSPQQEALFGLGCHPLDSLSINYKGRNQNMAIKYLTGVIPVMLSTRGYGLLWDNYSESNFYGTEANNTQYTYVSESGKMVDYYFFYRPSFDQIIKQ